MRAGPSCPAHGGRHVTHRRRTYAPPRARELLHRGRGRRGSGRTRPPSRPSTARANTTAATAPRPLAATAAPPFRFSRVGPEGPKQLSEQNLRKVAARDDQGQRRRRDDPGRLHLPRPVRRPRPHPRPHRRELGETSRRRTLLQGRSRRWTWTPCTARARSDPVLHSSTGRRRHLKIGRRRRSAASRAVTASTSPRGLGSIGRAQGGHPRPPQRREPRRRPGTTLAFIRFHNRVVEGWPRRRPPSGSGRPGVGSCATTSGCCAPTTCRGSSTAPSSTTSSPTGASSSSPAPPTDHADDAGRVLRRRLPARSHMIRGAYDWNRASPTARDPGPAVQLLGHQRRPRRAARPCRRNWIADWRRLFDFAQAATADLEPSRGEFNLARRIDTLLVDPLAALPRAPSAATVRRRARSGPTSPSAT